MTMNKQLRRLKWAVRQSYAKNVIAATAFSSTFLFLVVFNLDECSHFRVLPFGMGLNNCKGQDVRERLNSTLVAIASGGGGGHERGPLVPVDNLAVENHQQALLPEPLGTHGGTPEDLNSGKAVSVAPSYFHIQNTQVHVVDDVVFAGRREDAGKMCDEMLKAELEKENGGITKEGENPQPQDNETMTFRKAVHKAIYNTKVLSLMKYRNRPTKERPRFFQTTPSVKKNRWIHFHRIIKSPDNPVDSRVVDLTWCPIFKAASTPWLAVFTKLSRALTNYTEAQIRHGKLGFMELAKNFRLLTPRIYDKSINVVKYSMVVVRHPFKRLLSAYRDKIERVKGRLYYFKKYSSKIIAKFRKSELGLLERSSKDRDYSLKVPTFEEFVHYVLSSDPRKLDEHWRPMFLDCNPCHRSFDFILKVESLDEDKSKVMSYLGLAVADPQYKEVEDVWVRWNNPSGVAEPSRNESYYFSQLTIPDIQKLYELYEPDFKFYGYSPDLYYFMGKEDVVEKYK